jgi:OPA family glycerol-3-phosphate transporter-like MFS transporter
MGVISLSYLFGDAAARWFMGLLLGWGFGWREVFFTAAGVLFAFFALNWLWLRESPVAIGLSEPEASPLSVYGSEGGDARTATLGSLLRPLLTSPQFIVVCLLSLGLTLLRETFGTWSPIRSTPRASRRPVTARGFPCPAGPRCS